MGGAVATARPVIGDTLRVYNALEGVGVEGKRLRSRVHLNQTCSGYRVNQTCIKRAS